MNLFQPAARLRGIKKSAIRQLFDRAQPGDINLGLGEPDLPTPGVIRRAAAEIVTNEQNGYTTHAGLPALRALIAADYPELNATVNDVIVTAGSQEALYLALLTLVGEGDEVLLPDPGFVAYPAIVQMAGGTARYYRLPATQDFAFDADDFRRQLTPRTKAVVVISPSNPTGRALSSADLQAMADALRGTGVFVISDEIYREIYFDGKRPAAISTYYNQTIVLNGLSKSMSMTGWRLGWLCGPPEVVQSALVLHGYVTTCASTVSQKAALAAWTDEAEAARQAMRRTFQERRDYFADLIRRELACPTVAPDGAFYTMVNVERYGASSLAVAEKLLAGGVITVPGSAFGDASEGWLRVSFCGDFAKLTEGVRRMKIALGFKSQKS